MSEEKPVSQSDPAVPEEEEEEKKQEVMAETMLAAKQKLKRRVSVVQVCVVRSSETWCYSDDL